MIADAIEKVGNDGALSVQDGQTVGIELELTDGMRLERGWLSQDMVTDEARTEAVLDYPVHPARRPEARLGRAARSGARPGRADGQAAARDRRDDRGRRAADARHEQAARRRSRRSRSSRPEFGERRKRVLEDLAVLTGGEAVTEDLGLTLETIQLAQLGQAKRVVVDQMTTTIVGGRGDPAAVQQRIAQLRAELESRGQTHFDKGKLRERHGAARSAASP